MGVVGKVESLWRYPVKSMAGEEREEIFVGYAGVYGDRLFAVGNAAAPARFPYLTAREAASMLAYKPRFRHPEKAALPINLAEARGITPTIAIYVPGAISIPMPAIPSTAGVPPPAETFIAGVGQGASTTNKVFEAIWDGGGIDTYNLLNYSADLFIDLYPGEWSTFSTDQLADLDVDAPGASLGCGQYRQRLSVQRRPALAHRERHWRKWRR